MFPNSEEISFLMSEDKQIEMCEGREDEKVVKGLTGTDLSRYACSIYSGDRVTIEFQFNVSLGDGLRRIRRQSGR